MFNIANSNIGTGAGEYYIHPAGWERKRIFNLVRSLSKGGEYFYFYGNQKNKNGLEIKK